MTLTIGSLFAGIGGLELGLEWAGLGPTVWQVEIDPRAQLVLKAHWPEATLHEDVRLVGAATLVPVDIICGGFPCTDVSSAGKRAGITGARSGLWFEFRRIVEELCPPWVVVENVASGSTAWVDTVVGGLEQLGYACLPVPIAAADVGAPHERRRVFIVAAHAHARREHAGAINAEVAGASEPVADSNSAGVRDECRRGIGSNWSDASVTADNGNERVVANTVREGWQGRWPRSHSGRNRPAERGWRSPVPRILRVADGSSAVLDEGVNAHEECFEKACTAGDPVAWQAVCSLREHASPTTSPQRSPRCACCGDPLPELPHVGRRGIWYMGQRTPSDKDVCDLREQVHRVLAHEREDMLKSMPFGTRPQKRSKAMGPRPRIQALGNAVVPACAEVIGHIIQQLRAA